MCGKPLLALSPASRELSQRESLTATQAAVMVRTHAGGASRAHSARNGGSKPPPYEVAYSTFAAQPITPTQAAVMVRGHGGGASDAPKRFCIPVAVAV